MKQITLILLLLSSLAFSVQLDPPNEATVCVVGGLGDRSGGNNTNGGGATKAVWDATGDPNAFMATDGSAKVAVIDVVYDHTGNPLGERLLTKTNIGLNVTVGTIAYIENSDANVTTGWYEVTSRIDNNNICCAQIEATADTTIDVVRVGGAFATLQGALDCKLNDAGDAAQTYNRYIYDNIATETTAATIDVDQWGGSANTRVFVIGYNAALTAEAQIVITTASTLANGLAKFTGKNYCYFKNISFNAGGKDNNLGNYCINLNTGYVHTFVNCKFWGAKSHNIYGAGTLSHLFVNCESYLSGGSGCVTVGYSIFNACAFHDNDAHGCLSDAHLNSFENCLFYDNGKDSVIGSGLDVTGNYNRITHCVSFHNYADGFDLNAGLYTSLINNSSVNNTGYGYNFTNTIIIAYFGYNHSNGNTGVGGITHIAGIADASFVDYLGGNNQTGDPMFTKTLALTDVACADHITPFTITSVTGGFTADMVGRTLMIMDTGAGGHFVKRQYTVNSYVSTNEITLTADPTDGNNETAGDLYYYDFTPLTGSDLINNALAPMSGANNDIGALQEASGGGGTDIFGGVQ